MASKPEYIYKIALGSPSATPPASITSPDISASEPILAPSLLDVSSHFMHMSTAAQVPGTLKAFFVTDGDRRDSVWLLKVKLETVREGLRWEGPSGTGGAQDGDRAGEGLFPHLYFKEDGKIRLWLKVGEVAELRELVVPVGKEDGWDDALREVEGWLV